MTQPRDFGFDDEIGMLKDAARRFFAEQQSLVQLRRTLKGTEDPHRGKPREGWYDPASWKEMIELGWHMLAVPEAAGGIGMTRETSEDIFSCGVDVMTSGNHVYDKPEMMDYLPKEPRIVRAANFPDGAPGAPLGLYETPRGTVALLTVLGRTFMKPLDDPFATARRRILEAKDSGAKVVVAGAGLAVLPSRQSVQQAVKGFWYCG